MKKKMKRLMSGAGTVVALSMLANTTAFAKAVPNSHDPEAWNGVAMANDDMISTGINIRSGASEDSAVVGFLYHGGAVNVVHKGDAWTEVSSGGVTGYIKNEYLVYGSDALGLAQHYGTEGVSTSWNDIPMFSESSGSSSIVHTADANEEYITVSDEGDWISVQTGADSMAYVPSEDVQRVLLLDEAVALDGNGGSSDGGYSESYTDNSYDDGGYTDGSYDDGSYTDSSYDDGSYTDSSYDDGSYTDGSYDDGGYTDGNYDDGSYTDGSYDDGWYDDGSYDDGSYTDGSYDDGSYTDGSYDDGSYTDGSYDDGSYTDGSYDDGSYTDGSYDDGSYTDGSYDDGSYTDGSYDDGSYTDGSYDDGSYTDGSYDDSWYNDGDADDWYDDSSYDDGSIDDGSYDDGSYDDGSYDDGSYDDGSYDDGSADAGSTDTSVSSSDLDLLAAIIYCEAGNQSREGMVAVGAVVMNRVNSSSFPGTIREVIYQSGQFTPAGSGWLDSVIGSAPSACYEAAQAALNGENPVGGALYFNTGSGKGIKIGAHQFY